jgi:ubiquinone/menaquinone biosynthesis C-methylase UbiE
MRFAEAERRRGGRTALDLGCGAGRNLVPLAEQGWTVTGVDWSRPMLDAAAARIEDRGLAARAHVLLAPMDAVPVGSRRVDLIVAHGIWNLARSGREFRDALKAAARVARPGAALFVFTFSRNTLPPDALPVDGETFVYTQFSGEPQVFLTQCQLFAELRAAGFAPDPGVPLTEHNAPRPGSVRTGGAPAIYEAAFRFVGATEDRSSGA